jgi:hypothetical protein
MKIEIEHYKDNTDGSCTVILNTDGEANEFLIRYGLVAAIEDAINKAKAEYTPREDILHTESNEGQATADDIQRDMMKEELKALRLLVEEQDKALRHALELNTRLQKVPLSDDRIHALYRHTMDWRQLARDVEKEHGVGC